MNTTSHRVLVIAGVVAVQLGCVAAAVAPQLSARLTGDAYVLQVRPIDPLDPFRGAYVDLAYPDLRTNRHAGGLGSMEDGDSGAVYVTLKQEGEVWVADQYLRERPDAVPYLACDDRDWRIRCGIESWFLPQDEAREMERAVGDGAYAEVHVDGRGHAALVDVRETP